jgi:hypothetical protein
MQRDLVCFPIWRRVDPVSLGVPAHVTLCERTAEAVAALIPLLGCGEEAASLAFDGLAAAASDGLGSYALRAIAAEEREHDALLKRLARALPDASGGAETVRQARRFHISLGRGGPALHLVRIAAIDAATCTILSRLLRAGGPVSRDADTCQTLTRIRRDEARHVSVSRKLAKAASVTPAMRDVASAARESLADILLLGADAFEALAVDADALVRDVRRLPNGLLAA